MKFEDRLRNTLNDLETLSGRFDRWASSVGLPAEAGFATRLVLDEIVGNIIKYGGRNGAPGEDAPDGDGSFGIAVEVEFLEDRLSLRIEDAAPRFDPTAADPPALDGSLQDRPIGGLGLHLVRQTMDRMTYHRESGRNVLRLEKRIRPKGGSSDAG